MRNAFTKQFTHTHTHTHTHARARARARGARSSLLKIRHNLREGCCSVVLSLTGIFLPTNYSAVCACLGFINA